MNFEEITIRSKYSHRGGGIEIDLSSLGFEGEKMTAFCNSLGGGMLGKVQSDNTIKAFKKQVTDEQQEKLNSIEEDLKKHFYSLISGDDDDDFEVTYEQNQTMPSSAY